jgi:transketolase
MPTLNQLRADDADPLWPDRDRVLLAPDPAAQTGSFPAGPPGLAFGAALGLALAERSLASRFGRSLVDHRTWLVAGAEELASGPAQEAAAIAGALGLARLGVIANVPAAESAALARFAAVGWVVRRVTAGSDGELAAAVSAAMRAQKPTLVAVLLQGDARDGSTVMMAPSAYGAGARRAWLKRLRRHASAAAFQQALSGPLAPRPTPAEGRRLAPDAAVREALGRLALAMPELAILPGPEPVWFGRYHAMAGALLGLGLHGGLLPAAWFPAHAWAAMQPARQEAATRRLKMIMLAASAGTQDEEMAAPEFRPGSDGEAVDCLALALRWPGPAALALGAAGAAAAPPPPGACAQGGYVLAGSGADAVSLVAAGSDLTLALALRDALAEAGIAASVASLPCRRLFTAQADAARQAVLGSGLRIFLGTGGFLAWAGLTGPDDLVLDTATAPAWSTVVARIERRLRRSPDMRDSADLRLESAPQFD